MQHNIFGNLWGGFTILQLLSPDIVRNGFNQFEKKDYWNFFYTQSLSYFSNTPKSSHKKSSNLDEFGKMLEKGKFYQIWRFQPVLTKGHH